MHLTFKTEAEWHTIRESQIGGSEIACLFNVWRLPDGREVTRHLFEAYGPDDILLGSVSPHKTGYRLWLEKAHKLEPEMLDGIERIEAGKHLEPAIAAWAKRKWSDWPLLKSRVYHVHPRVAGWGASLDYFVRKGMEPVDVKNVDKFVFKSDWATEEADVVNFPLHIALQLQHQIACVEAEAAWILACVGGNELWRGRVHRHAPTIAKIEQAIVAFWDAVAEDRAPDHQDYDSVAELYAFGTAGAAVDLSGDASISRDIRRLNRWKAHGKFVEGQLDLMKGRIAGRVEGNVRATFDGGRLSWPVIERAEKQVSYLMPAKTYRGGMTITMDKPK
jgi:predicted phage-related endonuclease